MIGFSKDQAWHVQGKSRGGVVRTYETLPLKFEKVLVRHSLFIFFRLLLHNVMFSVSSSSANKSASS